MEKEKLERLKGLQREINIIKKEICEKEKELQIINADTIATELKECTHILSGKMRDRERLLIEFESWVDSVEDVDMRCIFRYVYGFGMTQKKAAASMGAGWSRASVAKRIERFFKKENIT